MAENLNIGSDGDVLSELSDEELAKSCRVSGSSAACTSELVFRYFAFIKSKAAQFSSDRSSYEDYVEEGLLGLMNAVRYFDADKGSSFSSYAWACVVNRMRSAAAKQSRVSESEEFTEEEHGEELSTPESIFIGRELAREIKAALSPVEFSAFSLYEKGMTSAEISDRLGISSKSADNAVQRAKRKLREYFSDDKE